MFNINTLAARDTFVLEIRHPESGEILRDDEGKTVSIELYGSASSIYRNAINAMNNRLTKTKRSKPTAEQMREESTLLLVACTAKMNNLGDESGVIKTKEQVKDLYEKDSMLWLRQQVDEAIGDIGNFLEK